MPQLSFAANLQRHVPVPSLTVAAATVREALDAACMDHPRLKGYILDEQGRLRRHVAVYVNGQPVRDRVRLADPVGSADEIAVFQALSGG